MFNVVLTKQKKIKPNFVAGLRTGHEKGTHRIHEPTQACSVQVFITTQLKSLES
jgi:hypothetical protein